MADKSGARGALIHLLYHPDVLSLCARNAPSMLALAILHNAPKTVVAALQAFHKYGRAPAMSPRFTLGDVPMHLHRKICHEPYYARLVRLESRIMKGKGSSW